MRLSNRKWVKERLFLILILGTLIRILAAFHFQSASVSLNYLGFDESVYYSLAKNMGDGSIFSYTLKGSTPYFQDYSVWYLEEPLFHHPPLFVWLLHLWHRILGDDLLVSRFLNVVLGSITIYITYLIGNRISDKVGLLSAMFLAISAINVQQSALILTDTLLTLLSGLFILFTLLFVENKSNFNLIALGTILGLSMWTKNFGLLSLSFIIFYIIQGKINKLETAAVMFIGLIVFAPWLVWNASVYGSLIPLETWMNLAAWSQVKLPFYSYLVFLPIVAPFSILGFMALFKSGDDPLKSGLKALVVSFLLVFSVTKAKEIRYIMPILVPLSILASDIGLSIEEKYKKIIITVALLVTSISGYIIVRANYAWYLPFWHYEKVLAILSL
jgi:4-amino-4-deoxy-L-arabinose transferase-like glycosyltransferase